MDDKGQSIYVHVEAHERTRGGPTAQHGATLFAAVYRTWTDLSGQTGNKVKKSHLATLVDQIERAAESSPRFVLMGDFNLDVSRKNDANYGRRTMLSKFTAAVAAAGLEYLATEKTFQSYGRFQDGKVQRHSTLDHCYVVGVSAAVRMLPDATTDH
jgi:endonuclease/exonuclease/phosphatase family metal-dependent hydrolase